MAYPKQYRYTKEHEWVDAKGDLCDHPESPTTRSMNWATSYSSSCRSRERNSKPEKLSDRGIGESGERDLCAGFRRSARSKRGAPQYSGKLNTIRTWRRGLIKARLTNASELNGLMDAAAYEAYIADKGKEASA